MEFQRICLVHYHEIGLKGNNRASFETRLLKNVKDIVRDFPVVTLRRISGRICVYIKEGAQYSTACEIADVITGVPGVARVSCGYKTNRDMEEIYSAAGKSLNDVQDATGFTTFKVAARRSHTDFPVPSNEINQLVGAHLCALFPDNPVKMKNPDVIVHVEVVQGDGYVFARSLPGIGGLPVGSSGRVVSLLSSGFDSPVATWKMARRGSVCIGVHFSGRPQTSATSEFLVEDIAEVLEKTGCIAKVYTVPIGDYQKEISLVVEPRLRVIMYRRLMFKIAQAIAQYEHAGALVTGESLGQVASQTIENMIATNQAVSMPIFRPLVGTDKLEILAEAQRLGTYDISASDAPDCCTLFMPRSPETHAKLADVLAAEELLPDMDAWIAQAFEAAEVKGYRCPGYKGSAVKF